MLRSWVGELGEVVPVYAGDVEFFIEVAEGEGLSSGAGPAGALDCLDFDGVAHTIRAIASSLHGAWEAVRPDEATIEFGLDATAKTGKLTGLLVEGDGKSSIKVTLVWKSSSGSATQ